MSASKTVGRTCSGCGAIYQGDAREASLPMYCPKCKANPLLRHTSQAMRNDGSPPVAIAPQAQPDFGLHQPVIPSGGVVAPPAAPVPPASGTTIPTLLATPALQPTVAASAAVKCYLCETLILVTELDPRCLPDQPMCKTCLTEFETFLPPLENVSTEVPPPLEISEQVVAPVEVAPSPMATDVFTEAEQPFVKAGLLYLTGRTGRVIIRADDWTVLEPAESGMVRIYIKQPAVSFEVVGTPERIVEVCGAK